MRHECRNKLGESKVARRSWRRTLRDGGDRRKERGGSQGRRAAAQAGQGGDGIADTFFVGFGGNAGFGASFFDGAFFGEGFAALVVFFGVLTSACFLPAGFETAEEWGVFAGLLVFRGGPEKRGLGLRNALRMPPAPCSKPAVPMRPFRCAPQPSSCWLRIMVSPPPSGGGKLGNLAGGTGPILEGGGEAFDACGAA